MSQVFISYASEDRPWVEPFAKTLEQQGWSVWWDRQIPTGHSYDDVIWTALQAAACVVVIWSNASIASEWVKEEASDAKKRNILLPIRIDEARPPFGFSRRQTQSLVGWQEGVSHPGYEQLLKDIATLLKAPPPVLPQGRSAMRAHLRSWLWPIVPTLLVLLLVPVLMAWRVPTHVEITLTGDRAGLTVGELAGGWTNLVGPLNFDTLLFRRFGRLSLSPHSIEVADPAQYDFDRDRYPASAWRPVALAGDAVELRPGTGARLPSVSARGDGTGQAVVPPGGRVDSLVVSSGSQVVVERPSGSERSLTIDIHAPAPHASFTPAGRYQLGTRHVTVQGVTLPSVADSEGPTLRIVPKPSAPGVTVEGESHTLAITVRVAGGGTDLFTGSDPLLLTAVDLSKQSETGARVSALSEQQETVIRYPDFPDWPAVRLTAPDYLSLEQLDRFVLKRMEWPPQGAGLRLVLDGVAGHVASQSGAFSRDHRLTQFDVLKHNPRLMALLAILGWVVPTVIGARKLAKELR